MTTTTAQRAATPASTPPNLRSPQAVRRRLDRLSDRHHERTLDRERVQRRLDALTEYLAIVDAVNDALDKLSEDLFGQIVNLLEKNLTLALRDVLDEPITLKVDRQYKRGMATIRFYIERDGEEEDIMRGQGGSVANILSVGLRMFALATLPADQHRRFLVLDEQDCWLRPDLVPRLVKLVRRAGRTLGFQVLMISHHDIAAFEQFADKIYKFVPESSGVRVVEWGKEACEPDDAPSRGAAAQSTPNPAVETESAEPALKGLSAAPRRTGRKRQMLLISPPTKT